MRAEITEPARSEQAVAAQQVLGAELVKIAEELLAGIGRDPLEAAFVAHAATARLLLAHYREVGDRYGPAPAVDNVVSISHRRVRRERRPVAAEPGS